MYRTSEGVWVRDHFSRSPPMSVNSLAMFQSDFKHPPMGGKFGPNSRPCKNVELYYNIIKTACREQRS